MAIGERLHHNWIVLLLALFVLGNAVRGVRKEEIPLLYGIIRKQEDPSLFWFAVITSAVLGLSGIIGAFL